jgi:hypothetical protein
MLLVLVEIDIIRKRDFLSLAGARQPSRRGVLHDLADGGWTELGNRALRWVNAGGRGRLPLWSKPWISGRRGLNACRQALNAGPFSGWRLGCRPPDVMHLDVHRHFHADRPVV